MTSTEMNNEFRLRLDKHASLSTKSYEDDEISSILTQAQLRIVKKYIKAYEQDEYARKVLSKLVTGPYAQEYVKSDSVNEGYPINTNSTSVDTSNHKLNSENIIFKLPENVLKVVYEELNVDNQIIDVIPTTHDEYTRIKRNKYRKQNDRKALRFDVQAFNILENEDSSNEAEVTKTNSLGHEIICSKFKDAKSIVYNIRFVQIPQNIVYSQIEEDCIDSYLSSFVHDEIVDEAVQLALEISQEPRLQTFSQIKQLNN